MRCTARPSFSILSRWVGQEGQREGMLHRGLRGKPAQMGCAHEGFEAGGALRTGHVGSRGPAAQEKTTFLGEGQGLDASGP